MKMKPDYARLLEAALTIHKWDGPTQVAANLTLRGYKVSEQMMTNWKNRGIPEHARWRAAGIVGCSVDWLETGIDPMVQKGAAKAIDAPYALNGEIANSHQAQSPLVVAAMRLDRSPLVPTATKTAITELLKSLLLPIATGTGKIEAPPILSKILEAPPGIETAELTKSKQTS